MCKRIFKNQTKPSGDVPFYTIGTFGKNPSAFIDKRLFDEYVGKYLFPKKGDILVSASGTIGRLVVYDGEPAYFQDSNIIWLQHDEGLILNTFLKYVYSRINWIVESSTMPRLYNNNFLATRVDMPDTKEQQKIATFLAAVDKRVALLERKVQQLEAYKRGVMQQLFSQQLRFTRPDGSHFPVWEKKQLGEVFLERSDRGIPGEMLSVTIANGVVPFSSIDKKDNSNPDKSKYKSVVKGDIVYNTMRMWQGASGLAVSSGICSPAYTVVIPKRGQLGLFWSYRIKNQDAINLFQRWSQGLTTDTWNLKFPAFSKLEFYCPSEQEQQKIAAFLSALDEKIALTRQQLDKTKQFKKGLLQGMFI